MMESGNVKGVSVEQYVTFCKDAGMDVCILPQGSERFMCALKECEWGNISVFGGLNLQLDYFGGWVVQYEEMGRVELMEGEKKVVLVSGCKSMGDLRKALDAGADLVDGTFVYTQTELFKILWIGESGEGEEDALADVSGMGALCDGCVCWTCRTHSRRYVRHLLEKGEIGGKTALYAHNAYQVGAFVDKFREKIINECML